MKKLTLYHYYIWLLLSVQSYGCAQQSIPSISIKSPDKGLVADFKIDGKGQLMYTLVHKGYAIIEPSPIGIIIENVAPSPKIKFGEPHYRTINEEYETRGIHTKAINHFQEVSVPIIDGNNTLFYLEGRIYNDGFAYRYRSPGKGIRTVNKEETSWTIPKHSKVWFTERNNSYKLKSYAGEWMPTAIENLETISKQGPMQAKPLIIELTNKKGYLLITEAALYDYSGMRLKAIGNRTIVADFTEGDQGFKVNNTVLSPWRVSLFVENLNDLVNSDLISNLNPAPDPKLFATTDYIKPGKSVWRWWHKNTGTIEQEIEYIEYADQLGFQYTMVDEGWEKWSDKWAAVKKMTVLGKKKGVGVFLWKHSKELKDQKDNWFQMRSWLDSVRTSGAVGIKVDFMNSESKEWIDFEIKFLKETAKRQLMTNFHGCHPPTGESRTYPNEITREGIRGLELNRMGEGPIPSSHNAALPFTRYIIGHGDYTPLGFTNPGNTTWAHQIATTVLFNSPLQVISEDPYFLLNSKKITPILPLLKNIPTVWDETIVLQQSEIGQLAVIAKRSGNDWYIGILNDDVDKSISIDLSFLNNSTYSALIVVDDTAGNVINIQGLNQTAKLNKNTPVIPFKINKTIIKANSKITVHLLKNGGSMMFLQLKKE